MSFINFDINKTVTKLGSDIIFTPKEALKDILAIISYSDEVVGTSNNNKIARHFSFTNDVDKDDDKKNWSQWHPTNDANLSTLIDLSCPFYIKFRFTVIQKLESQAITVKSLKLSVDQKDVEDVFEPANAIEIVDETGYNHQELVEPFADLYNDMNKWANKSTGTDVIYFHVTPDVDSADVFLKEYSLFDLENSMGTCIKVVLPEGIIPPEDTHQFDDWGIDFEKFEVHLDNVYFQEIFGKGEEPNIEDFFYLKFINRLYRVESRVLNKQINGEPSYWVLSMAKYDYNTAVTLDEDTEELVEDSIQVHEEKFAEEIADQMEDVVNVQQNSVKTISDDIVRELVNEGMSIVDDCVFNNGSVLIKSWYDMTGIPKDEVAVRYRKYHKLLENEAWTLLEWFNLPVMPLVGTTLNVVTQQRLDFSRLQLTFDKEIIKARLEETDSIIRGDEVYDINEIIDDFNIVVSSRTDLDPSKLDNFAKAHKTNHIATSDDNIEFSICVYNGSILRVRFNNTFWDFKNLNLENDRWYGLDVGISNAHGFVGVYIWKLENRAGTSDAHSTRLIQHYKREITVEKNCIVIPEKSTPYINGSHVLISNVRILKMALPEENQSYVLGTHSIKKASLAYLIDDADVIFNLGVLGRGNTYETEREDIKNEEQ